MDKVLDLFSDFVVIDEEGKERLVPIRYSETNPNVDFSAGDTIELPQIILEGRKPNFILHAISLHQEEMNQLVEQIIIKFGPTARNEDVSLKLGTITNNVGQQGSGDRVIHFRFDLESVGTPKSFISNNLRK
jgi:hypothetical protein